MTGVFSKNREEWLTLDIANTLYNMTTIPLYDALGPQAITYIIKHSNLKNCFCDSKSL